MPAPEGVGAMKHWTLDDIPWDRFDPSKVDPETLKFAKAAAMVEYNSAEYATYLGNVFGDDPEFQQAAWTWAEEEVQHGKALARWAQLADPGFDFDACFQDFADKIKLPQDANESVRGSRVGELVARCMVECGTSSIYSAMAAGTEEPVLNQICRNIAGDEFRHYKLFYSHLKRYLEREKISRWRRFWVALGRAFETEDDELAYAYYAANHAQDGPYEHKRYNRAYARRAYRFYRYGHVERAAAMAFKAIGLKPHGRLNRGLAWISYRFLRFRARRLEAMGA